jgi:hypothetical protein
MTVRYCLYFFSVAHASCDRSTGLHPGVYSILVIIHGGRLGEAGVNVIDHLAH